MAVAIVGVLFVLVLALSPWIGCDSRPTGIEYQRPWI